jgi:hypothetical protein
MLEMEMNGKGREGGIHVPKPNLVQRDFEGIKGALVVLFQLNLITLLLESWRFVIFGS